MILHLLTVLSLFVIMVNGLFSRVFHKPPHIIKSSINAADDAGSLAIHTARREASPDYTVPLSAFSTAMRRLETYETLPSCHRKTLGHLASDCSKLYPSNTSPYADKHRMEVAVRIALCEFESAGVDTPSQCSNLRYGTEDDASCIQALSKNPQMWTTLSNSLQTLLSACDSVRAETERDEILRLYKNITTTEYELFNAVRASVEELVTAADMQKEFSRRWKDTYEDTLEEYKQSKASMIRILEGAGESVLEMLNSIVNSGAAMKNEVSSLAEQLHSTIVDSRQSVLQWQIFLKETWYSMEQASQAAQNASSDLLTSLNEASVSVDRNSATAFTAFTELATLISHLNTEVESAQQVMAANAEAQKQLWKEYDERIRDTQELLFSVRSMLQTLTTIFRWVFVDMPQIFRALVFRLTLLGPALYFVGSLAAGQFLSLHEGIAFAVPLSPILIGFKYRDLGFPAVFDHNFFKSAIVVVLVAFILCEKNTLVSSVLFVPGRQQPQRSSLRPVRVTQLHPESYVMAGTVHGRAHRRRWASIY